MTKFSTPFLVLSQNHLELSAAPLRAEVGEAGLRLHVFCNETASRDPPEAVHITEDTRAPLSPVVNLLAKYEFIVHVEP